ncbi:MAG: PHP domain-containing protein [Bacteroidales bacterium]|nr:PHP domain-containing protein [Bacteroidales bacterium]
MDYYRADLHVHSMLSPCGDMTMNPARIIQAAKTKNIDILGITDHNSTLHSKLMIELGAENDIKVLPGVEVNTSEEIHCLAFFENLDITNRFQEFLDENLPDVPNNSTLYGFQVLVDRDGNIIKEIDKLLVSALKCSIYEVAEKVYELGGIFIPAHVDRPYNSLLSQLGSIPNDLKLDALEVSARFGAGQFREMHPELKDYTLITNSDAHHPDMIARATTQFRIAKPSFSEIKKALHQSESRKTRTV